MIVVPDKQTVRTAFSRAADGYDRWAEHHRIVADRLCGLLRWVAHDAGSAVRTPRRARREASSAAADASASWNTGAHGPHSGPYAAGHPCMGRVLELGCGTGILTMRLRAAYPASAITAIDIAPGMVEHCRGRWPGDTLARFLLADAESFVPDQPADLIVSSCMLQWLADRQAAVHRFASLLASRGRVAIAVPVQGTLGELATSYRAAVGRDMPELDFWPPGQYVRLFEQAGMVVMQSVVADVCVRYDEPCHVLAAVKGIGAALSGQPGTKLLPPSALRALLEHYRRDFCDAGRVAATYRVLYLVAGEVGRS